MVINRKAGFIDKTGKIVIRPQFRLTLGFSEGLAPVKIDNKMGYIDKTAKILIRPQFDFAGWFSQGLAYVKSSDKEGGYIDKTGKYVWGPTSYKLGGWASRLKF